MQTIQFFMLKLAYFLTVFQTGDPNEPDYWLAGGLKVLSPFGAVGAMKAVLIIMVAATFLTIFFRRPRD